MPLELDSVSKAHGKIRPLKRRIISKHTVKTQLTHLYCLAAFVRSYQFRSTANERSRPPGFVIMAHFWTQRLLDKCRAAAWLPTFV